MKTTFFIDPKDFENIKISVNKKIYSLKEKTTIEYPDTEILYVTFENESIFESFKRKVKNPLLRFLIYIPLGIVWFIISAITFFVDIEDTKCFRGYTFFEKLSPFTIKKTYILKEPNEKEIVIGIKKAKYNSKTKTYCSPDIDIENESANCIDKQTKFSAPMFKRQLFGEVFCGFFVLLIVTLALNLIDFMIFAKVFREVPLNSISFNIFAIIGMIIVSLIMLTLFALVITFIIRTFRLYNAVLKNHENNDYSV